MNFARNVMKSYERGQAVKALYGPSYASDAYTKGISGLRPRPYLRAYIQTRLSDAIFGPGRGKAAHTIQRAARGYLRRGGYYNRQEVKFIDVGVLAADIPALGVIKQMLPDIPTGTGESDRIGRFCTITKFTTRFVLDYTESVDTASGSIRILIFIDTQTNGALPTGTEILQAPLTYTSWNNLSNSGRFKTLKDYFFSFNTCAAVGDGTTNLYSATQRVWTWSYNQRIRMEYSGVTGSTAERRSNNIYCMILADEDDKYDFTFHTRFRFIDGK